MAETQEAGRSYAGVILAAAPEAKAEADAPMPRVSYGTQVINDTELTYAGRWESLRILPRAFGYSNNTCSSSREAGAEASYAFSSCEGIAWYAAGRQARMQPQEAGEADVYVDGVFLATVRASQEKPDVPVFTTGPLKKGPHTLRLVARSAQPVEIDRLEALGEPAYPLFISSRNGAYMHVSPGLCRGDVPAGEKRLADGGRRPRRTVLYRICRPAAALVWTKGTGWRLLQRDAGRHVYPGSRLPGGEGNGVSVAVFSGWPIRSGLSHAGGGDAGRLCSDRRLRDLGQPLSDDGYQPADG